VGYYISVPAPWFIDWGGKGTRDRRDCRTAGTEGPLYEARPPHHRRRATPEEPPCSNPWDGLPWAILDRDWNKIIDDILELLNKNGQTSHQCKSLGRSARTQFSLYPRPFKLVFRAAPQV